MSGRQPFECPICCGYQYNELTDVDGPKAGSPIYVCACCGLVFVEPRRYRRALAPISVQFELVKGES